MRSLHWHFHAIFNLKIQDSLHELHPVGPRVASDLLPVSKEDEGWHFFNIELLGQLSALFRPVGGTDGGTCL